MKTTLKQENILSKVAENIRVIVVGKRVAKENQLSKEYLDEYFPIAKVSNLSIEDEFLKHTPQTERQKKFKKMLMDAIKSGLSDFRAQRMDPSFDREGNLCYTSGMQPAVGKSANWWNKKAKEFMPLKGSRLGTTRERIAFLGLIIKYLIEEKGYTIANAWKAVCDCSQGLGHYLDSEDAKDKIELTGRRQVGEWYDLANTCKITLDETCGFSLTGGDYAAWSNHCPLADVAPFDFYPSDVHDLSTGWIVLAV